jgi:WXG100 family type VII secretion target
MPAISQVELQGLVQTAQGQEQAIDGAQADLNQVVSHCQTLASAWTGEAASIYQSAMSNFNESASKVIAKLREMHELMVSTHGVFSNTNQNITATARQAGSNMDAGYGTGLSGL